MKPIYKSIYFLIFGQGLAYRGERWWQLAEWVKGLWIK